VPAAASLSPGAGRSCQVYVVDIPATNAGTGLIDSYSQRGAALKIIQRRASRYRTCPYATNQGSTEILWCVDPLILQPIFECDRCPMAIAEQVLVFVSLRAYGDRRQYLTNMIGNRVFMGHQPSGNSAQQRQPSFSGTAVALAPRRVSAASEHLRNASASTIIRWGLENFGDKICVATSFTDTVLIHLITQINPEVEVIFLDTGFHFPETLQTMKRAQARYQLNLRVVRPQTTAPDVWNAGSSACCDARKVVGLRTVMAERNMEAWFSGVRRADSEDRAEVPVVGLDSRGYIKVNPLAAWSDDDVAEYASHHDLITNELTENGYSSVGCWPCTEPSAAGDNRAGRRAGESKTECGLHL